MKCSDVILLIVGRAKCHFCTQFKKFHLDLLKEYIASRYKNMEVMYVEMSETGASTPTERDIIMKLDMVKPKSLKTRWQWPLPILVSSNYKDSSSDEGIICQYLDYHIIAVAMASKSGMIKDNEEEINVALDMYMDAEMKNFAVEYKKARTMT